MYLQPLRIDKNRWNRTRCFWLMFITHQMRRMSVPFIGFEHSRRRVYKIAANQCPIIYFIKAHIQRTFPSRERQGETETDGYIIKEELRRIKIRLFFRIGDKNSIYCMPHKLKMWSSENRHQCQHHNAQWLWGKPTCHICQFVIPDSNTLASISIWHRPDAKVSDRYPVYFDPRVFTTWGYFNLFIIHTGTAVSILFPTLLVVSFLGLF